MTKKKPPQLDYSVRYGSNYSSQSAIAWKRHEKLGNICVCCLKKKAKELHHTSYGGKPLNRLYDNWYPVCLTCHKKAHRKGNWSISKTNPVWKNKSSTGFKSRLDLGVNLLRLQDAVGRL
jgi:hypothetical protein